MYAILSYVRNESWHSGSFPPITLAAGFAILALIGATVWQLTTSWRGTEVSSARDNTEVSTTDSNALSESYFNWQRAPESSPASDTSTDVSDPDGLSYIEDNVLGTLVSSYVTLKDSGTYTPTAGEQVAGIIAAELRANISYRTYSSADIETVSDTSLSRTLLYRNDLRIALEPLLQNTEYELEVFAYYLDTNNAIYLNELSRMSENYRATTENVLGVVVPGDAVTYHVGILNALSEFEATLAQMTKHADDPYAAAALLRTFNTAEINMLTSFNALAGYFRDHSRS